VAGRKLQQKCRKCGAQMLIDGTGVSHDHTPMSVPSAAAASDQAVWHIALGDTTQGPYTLEELAQYYADGSIVLDTMVCRDGWTDWKPAGEISELREASRGPALVSMAPPPAAGFVAASIAEPVAMGRDPFGDSAIDSGPRVSIDEMQTLGAQRDGTVQFSMDQIRALSSASAPSVPPPAPISTAGYASGGDSGLIDMRALAEAEAKAAAEAAQAALSPAARNDAFRSLRTSEMGPMQGLSPLTLGSGGSGGVDFRTKVMASLAAFAALLTATVVIVVLTRDTTPVAASDAAQVAPAEVTAAATAPAAPPAIAMAAAVAAQDRRKAAATEGDDEATDEDEADEDDRDGSPSKSRRSARRARRGGGGDRPSAKSSGKNTDLDDVLAKAEAPKRSSSGSSIDDLLEGAINGKRSAPKVEPREPASSLPKTPSREEMLTAFGRAKAKTGSCKGTGVAMTSITVAGKSGKATSVSVTGVDGGAKACVEKAVRSTRFPKFQNDSMKVQFPFKIGA
jgi:hypothetical protein